jgi:hypothetical protein
MKIKTILSIIALACTQSSFSQVLVDYQGKGYPTDSPISQEYKTVKIRPFDENKFKECNGIIEKVINGQNIKLDCKKIYPDDLTMYTLEVPYEVKDSAIYQPLLEQRIAYITQQLSLLSDVKELINNFKELDGKEPIGNTQRLYFSTLMNLGNKSTDEKILSSVKKAQDKNKFNKKLEPLNENLLSQIQFWTGHYNIILKTKENWDEFFGSSLNNRLFISDENNVTDERITRSIRDFKMKTLFAKISNPFLLDAIDIPNPNYEEPQVVDKSQDTYFVYENRAYNYTMQVPMCFKSDYDLFNKGEISDYDFLYADGGLCMLNVATKKHSGYMYLDGQGIYDNDMTYGVYQKFLCGDVMTKEC